MAAINDLFSRFGPPAKTKLLLLGSPDFRFENLMNRVRSLNLEHVSPAKLMRSEISRRPGPAGTDEATALALLRRWFFARKPDAGFVLADFPATLLQAKVFDEWLDARDEALTASILTGPGSPESVVQHYRTLGLLWEPDDLVAAGSPVGEPSPAYTPEGRS
jgi:adenylate kinase